MIALFLAGVAVLSPVASATAGEDLPELHSPAALLASAAEPSNSALLEAGLRSTVLSRFGRLLPDVLTDDERLQWAAMLQAPAKLGDDALEKAAAALPGADELVFDGQRYVGGNLAFIDSLLGTTGRPIAFDRALPGILVPLSPEAESAVNTKRTEFQAKPENRALREASEKSHGAASADALFADGQYLRPYAGRFDDLYFHLSQNGNGPSSLAFGALVDGLAQRRTYRPVNGVCQISRVPAASFDLSNILTDGGKAAVVTHLRQRYERPIEPFRGFAFRILPTIIGRVRSLPSGARFSASTPEMLQALRARQHYYPIQVPPIYRSPDRFLGWAGSMLIPVAANPVLPPGAAESWYPLPQRSGRVPADAAADGASSSHLFESHTAPELPASPDGNWEDPQISSLLGGPETKTQPGKPSPESAAPANPADPRLRPVVGRLIAVVTPTVDEATAYLASIAASDETLRALERIRGRARLQRLFLESGTTAAPDELKRAIAIDLAALTKSEKELEARMQETLQQRAALRRDLEEKLTRERVHPLEALGKKEAEPETGAAKPVAGVTL